MMANLRKTRGELAALLEIEDENRRIRNKLLRLAPKVLKMTDDEFEEWVSQYDEDSTVWRLEPRWLIRDALGVIRPGLWLIGQQMDELGKEFEALPHKKQAQVVLGVAKVLSKVEKVAQRLRRQMVKALAGIGKKYY